MMSCSCAATSGRRLPRSGCTPLRRRPMVRNLRFRAFASVGSAPSGSSSCASSIAYCRRSSGVAGGPPPSVPPSASGSPRARSASAASAATRSSDPIRSPACRTGPVAASTPATPITPSSIVWRIAGKRAGSRSPVVSATSRRTASAAFTTRDAPGASTRSTRCRSSFIDRHPVASAKRGSAEAVVSTTMASTRRSASPAPRSTSSRAASSSPASCAADSTASRSATTRSRASARGFIRPSHTPPPTLQGRNSPVQRHFPGIPEYARHHPSIPRSRAHTARRTIPVTTTRDAAIRQPPRDSRSTNTPNRLTSTTLTSRRGATSATGAIWIAVSTRM